MVVTSVVLQQNNGTIVEVNLNPSAEEDYGMDIYINKEYLSQTGAHVARYHGKHCKLGIMISTTKRKQIGAKLNK